MGPRYNKSIPAPTYKTKIHASYFLPTRRRRRRENSFLRPANPRRSSNTNTICILYHPLFSGLNCPGNTKLTTNMIDIHFDDVMTVVQLDPDGKKFDKVSRIVAQSEKSGTEMLLDVNVSIYSILVGEKLRMAITTSLYGSAESGGKEISLADKFEYVMHGLLYKMSDETSKGQSKVSVYISFGGLQLMLKGDPILMGNFKVDQNLYLLIRKI